VRSPIGVAQGASRSAREIWIDAQDKTMLFISAVSVLEIRCGIYKLELRSDFQIVNPWVS
jgi:predicted nucleic acid-binding protein